MAQRAQQVQGVPLGAPAIDPHGGHLWYPAGASEQVQRVVPYGTGETGIIAATGNWANYEVWADVPATWLNVELLLRLKNGELVNDLDRRTPAQMEHATAFPPDSGAGVLARTGVPPTSRLRGLLFSSYGRPGYGELSVTALQREDVDAGGNQLNQTGGKFLIRFWGTEGATAGDRVGRPIVDRWAGRQQEIVFADLALPVDGAPIPVFGGFVGGGFAPAGATPRTVHITSVMLSSDMIPSVSVTLQQTEPVTGTVITKGQFWVASLGPVAVCYGLPVTGNRGWNWELLRGAGLGNMAATIQGYEA